MPAAAFLHREDGVAVLTLADPDRRNAITAELAGAVAGRVAEAVADPDIRCLIVTGDGPAFCAGADLSALGEAAGAEDGLRDIYRAFTAVRDCPLATVAAVNGPAVGAGVNLALACDVRLAGRRARFDTRFLRIGLHPGGGHLWGLHRAVGAQSAAVLALFGRPADAAEAERIGLVASVHDDVVAAARELAEHVAAAPRALVERIKQSWRAEATLPDAAAALEYELDPQLDSMRQDFFAPRIVR